MNSKRGRKRTAILEVLRTEQEPVSSAMISAELMARGVEASERTVREYLSQLRGEGLSVAVGKRGHRVTAEGLAELDAATLLYRVGFLSAKIDEMTYRMDFDLNSRRGTVVVNTSLVPADQLAQGVERICRVFEKGYAMGTLMALLSPGEKLGQLEVPAGQLGFCTVCSITLNGVLLKYGIPTRSRFGGLLELVGGRATRFVELITYDGTSIDPLEVFIRSGMTNYTGAITDGNGRIGASFREVPADSRRRVVALAAELDAIGLGAFLKIGHSGQPLFNIPVGEGHAGAVVIGGLNPISILEEMGYRIESRAMSGLLEYGRLFPYAEFPERLAAVTAVGG
ncbi:MAG: NrpR regulatory domain-containing protein [Deferrisomatales bacterium]|nr:NrpR regulatory domain-containing protein [Deferrisomatales bacterium]